MNRIGMSTASSNIQIPKQIFMSSLTDAKKSNGCCYSAIGCALTTTTDYFTKKQSENWRLVPGSAHENCAVRLKSKVVQEIGKGAQQSNQKPMLCLCADRTPQFMQLVVLRIDYSVRTSFSGVLPRHPWQQGLGPSGRSAKTGEPLDGFAYEHHIWDVDKVRVQRTQS